MNNQASKQVYILKDESGKKIEVRFERRYQLENWVSMEENIFKRKYVIVN